MSSHIVQKDISGCAIFGMINQNGKRMSSSSIVKAIALMHERSNGLGGGFAAYGIYPKHKDHYALHMLYGSEKSKESSEEYLYKKFAVDKDEEIPTRKTEKISSSPIIHRYFVSPDNPDQIVEAVMHINSAIEGAFMMSSGKNMGVFKAVGYPEDAAGFYKLEDYQAYIWTAHGRFPTNTPGWWGGAHPFSILDWSIVHNGEISSYGINKRYLEMFGYKCTLMTDTEVMTYFFDLLIRKHKLTFDAACAALAAPLWNDIDRENKQKESIIRIVYSQALVNGPFAVIVGHNKGLIGLNDRMKLRPLTAAKKGDMMYIASEESSIHEVCKNPEKIWAPRGGEPIIASLYGNS